MNVMDALGYLTKTYNLDLKGQLPIELPTIYQRSGSGYPDRGLH